MQSRPAIDLVRADPGVALKTSIAVLTVAVPPRNFIPARIAASVAADVVLAARSTIPFSLCSRLIGRTTVGSVEIVALVEVLAELVIVSSARTGNKENIN